MSRQQRQLAVLVLAALVAAQPARAGQWIGPGPGAVLEFRPVTLFTPSTEEVRPLIYRTVVDVPDTCDRVSAMLRTGEWAYVCVDGRQVFGWTPPAKRPTAKQLELWRAQFHRLDLTDVLTPGRHVLTISASGGGLVLDGGLYAGSERLAPLASGAEWTITCFAPTTVVEDESVMTLEYDGAISPHKAGPAVNVTAGASWTASEDALAQLHFQGRLKSYRRGLEEATWALRLFGERGVYLAGHEARGWGGSARLDPNIVQPCRPLLREAPGLEEQLGQLGRKTVRTAAELKAVQAELTAIGRRLAQMQAFLRDAWQRAAEADEARAIALARQAAGIDGVDADAPLAEQRRQLEQALGHPLAPLNQSRFDRLGWLPYSRLTDSDLARWGVRVNPVQGPTEVQAEPEWQFLIDPKDVGVTEQRWRRAARPDRPWEPVELPHDWAAAEDAQMRAYSGVAWYRGRIVIPGEWAGQEVLLSLTVAGQERLWINGREVSDRGQGQRKRRYTLSPEDLAGGGENFLTVRVDGSGPWRGLVGSVTAACPALEGPAGRDTPPVEVLATPLSPCVILRPRGSQLYIHHAGKAALGLPGKGEVLPAEAYQAEQEGALWSNWVLLWLKPASSADVRRPILLVFERNPESILPAQGVTKITLRGGPQQVVAVRPWARQHPAGVAGRVELLDRIDFWSRAARAVPVNYATITRVVRPGGQATAGGPPAWPVLEQTVVYDYVQTADAWRTGPLKIAPLPALCAYALAAKLPGLAVTGAEAVESFQDGGLAGGYYGVRDASSVRYRYGVQPWPRRMGFTTPMLQEYGVGAPGNGREAQAVAAAGANSLRVVHNWSNEGIAGQVNQANPPRLVALADACRAAGIGLSTACTETLGGKDERIAADYEALADDLGRHYEKIAALLADRPFEQVAYDLVDDPGSLPPHQWGQTARRLTERIRAIDARHLITVEAAGAWEPIDGLDPVEPTGDELTLYGFADFTRRLTKPADRWPDEGRDIDSICNAWWPAIAFSLRHGVPLHCTRYGQFDPSTADSPAQRTLMEDCLRLFDQFGMHAHYAPGRSALELLADGSLRPAGVVRVLQEYARRGGLDRYVPQIPASREAADTDTEDAAE